jgi:hypothetical protein
MIRVVLALALALPPDAAAPAPADPRALHEDAKAKLAAGDVAGAIAGWQAARAALPAADMTAAKAEIGWNLVVAHEQAFVRSRDLADLDRAVAELDAYSRAIESAYATDATALAAARDKADRKRAELEASRPPAPVDPIPAPTQTSTVPPAPIADELGETDAIDPEPEPPPRPEPRREGRGLIGVGAVSLALGVAGFAVMGAGLNRARTASEDLPNTLPGPSRDEAIERGLRGNQMAIAGAVIGGVLVPTAIALIAAGVVRRKRGQSRLAVAPTWTNGPGVALSWRL